MTNSANTTDISHRTNVRLKFIVLVIMMILAPSVALNAQRIIDPKNITGTYVVTDYLNRKITLKIGQQNSSDYIFRYGRGTINVNGRTLPGKWSLWEEDGFYYLGFNTYDDIPITYALPEGSARTSQIIISQDGRASYNGNELMKSDGDWVKGVKKVSGKKASKRRRK